MLCRNIPECTMQRYDMMMVDVVYDFLLFRIDIIRLLLLCLVRWCVMWCVFCDHGKQHHHQQRWAKTANEKGIKSEKLGEKVQWKKYNFNLVTHKFWTHILNILLLCGMSEQTKRTTTIYSSTHLLYRKKYDQMKSIL